jgi:flagellin-like protein
MQRGAIPVVGVVLLLAITVLSAATVGLVVSSPPSEPPPTASFELSVDGESDEIELTHLGGDTIDLTAVSVRISVDGTRLEKQPPIPFFSASGYESGPTGPFNRASPNEWEAGETATLTVASTNDPELSAGDTVRVQLYTDTATVADLTVTA